MALLGFSLYNSTITKSCDLKELTYIQNLQKYIDEYSNYGAVQHGTLSSLCDAKQVCFVSASSVLAGSTANMPGISAYPVIENSVRDKVQKNIFLVTSKQTKPLGYAEKLEVNNNFLCINSSSTKVTFRGTGSTTIIEEYRG